MDLIAVTGGLLAVIALLCVALVAVTRALHDARKRILRSREFVQRLIDVVPEPVFVKDTHGRYIAVNQAFCAQRGVSSADILGRTAVELCGNKNTALAVSAEDTEVLGGRRVFKEELYRNPLNGAERHRIISKGSCLDEFGNPVIIGTHIDTTDWRIAERALQDALDAQSRSREFLQSIFDALPNPLFVKDAEGRYIMTNRAHVASVGALGPEDVIFRRAADFSTPEVAAAVEATERALLTGPAGQVHEREYTLHDARRKARQVIIRKVASHDGQGRQVIIGINTDVTALRRAEARWQFALEGAGDGIWDWDVGSERVNYSSRWKAMLGYFDHEIAERLDEWTSRIHPDDEIGAMEALQTHLDGYAPVYVCEYRIRCKDGSYKWIFDRGRIIERDAQGAPARVIGIHADITERKRIEEELRVLQERMQELVRTRTAELSAAKEDAERANDARAEILASLSQELRSPMHAIMNFAHLGENRADRLEPDKLRAYFEHIGSSGGQMLNLIGELLALSRLDATHLRLEMRPLDLHGVLDEASREFDAWMDAKRLNLIQHRAAGSGRILGDAARLGQVIRHLMSNAIKFSPEGRHIIVRVNRIALQLSGRDVDGIELAVADEGPGIPHTELDAIFERPLPADGTRNNGIGLAICRRIVEAHHGEIFARNLSVGAEIVMRLPCAIPMRVVDAA